MNEPQNQRQCVVVALVPHPTNSSLLSLATPPQEGEGELQLPRVEVAAEPEVEDLVTAFSELLDTELRLLRANTVSWYDNFDAASMFVEFEPLTSEAPNGFAWRVGAVSRVDTTTPDWARRFVASWLHERASGWSPLRPPWSRPGWMSEASQWMLQQMENHGYVEPQSPRTHHLWGLSVVLSAAALNGTAYLKCSGDHFRSEPVVTRALAERSPELLPEVIAIDEDRGWLLMRDLGAGPLGPQPESTWGRGLDALARLQKQWQGRTDDLLASGAQDRPLEVLAAWVDNTETDTDLLAPMTREERETWLASVPTMVDSCHRLAAIGPEPTLVHGDFHPWNVVCSETETRIFDWTDASVGHPFLDVATYVMRSTSTDVRPAMLHNYLGEWAADLRGESVDDVGHLALVVGALHQAHTYSRLIPTVMPDDLGDLGGGDAQWLRRAMRFSVDGIRSAY